MQAHQDAFVYRVAHCRAMDASTTAESLGEDDSTVGRDDENSRVGYVRGLFLALRGRCAVYYTGVCACEEVGGGGGGE